MIVSQTQRLTINRSAPLLVALDGRSGSGKSTLSSLTAEKLGASLVRSDDFYAAEVSDTEWDSLTPAARAAIVIDWKRLRREALEPLLLGHRAKWHPFDFDGMRPDGTYSMSSKLTHCDPASVIVLEGAFSTRPELGDLIDFSVLVDAPVDVCHRRLAARESAKFLCSWHARWDVVEEYYFTLVRPKSSFDLIVTNEDELPTETSQTDRAS